MSPMSHEGEEEEEEEEERSRNERVERLLGREALQSPEKEPS